MADLRIFLSAGEISGDLTGAALVEAIRRRHPETRFAGLGGPRMAQAGVRLLAGLEQLAVVGFAEVVRHLPFFLRLRSRVAAELDGWRPDLVIPIDYPGFNLWLTQAAHARGLRVLYYIAPQVWAWRWNRVRTLADAADAVAVVFPFEEELLRAAGVPARFVGHPLVERSTQWPGREEARRRLGIEPDVPLLGLFPGSRASEVRRLMGPFWAAAQRVRRSRPQLRIGVAPAPGLRESLYAAADPAVVRADGTTLLKASTAILTKSGTTTVEAAFAGTPLVIAYRVHPLSYAVARRVVSVPHIGMINLLARRRIAPEFVQAQVRPEPIAEALAPLLDEGSDARRRMIADLESVRRGLGSRAASAETAELAEEILARPHSTAVGSTRGRETA